VGRVAELWTFAVRKSLLILFFVELLFAVALGQMGPLDRPKMAHAFMEWRQHPTVETRQAFERERRITEYERWGFSGVVFAVLAGATAFVSWLRRGEQGAPGNSRHASQSNPL
jgi:hypothetical protein